MASPTISIRVPFAGAIDHAKRRGIELPDEFYVDLPEAVMRQAFTVSGLAVLDQIQQVRDSLTEVIAKGQTFPQWQAEALRNIDALATLPSGRMETIYRNAIQTSYSSGRWAQFERAKNRRPYLIYDAINDGRTRPEHRAMDNFIAPVGDPIWDIWATPNGHNCRCSLRAITEEEAIARGWEGATKSAPAEPDEGWDYNPGKPGAQEEKLKDLFSDKANGIKPRIIQTEQGTIKRSIEGYISGGREISLQITDPNIDAIKSFSEVIDRLSSQVGTSTPAKTASKGAAAKLLADATTRFPDSWTKGTDNLGNLFIRQKKGARAWHITPDESSGFAMLGDGFGAVGWDGGRPGFILVGTGRIQATVHEYAHRVQTALPELDMMFQGLHKRRTSNDKLESLRSITGRNYGRDEFAKKDGYITPYQGKEYPNKGAIEVMPVSLEYILGVDIKDRHSLSMFTKLYNNDRELFDFTLGLLFNWEPGK